MTDETDILKKCADLQKIEGHELTRISSTECPDDRFGPQTNFPLEKVHVCMSRDAVMVSFTLSFLSNFNKELKHTIISIIISCNLQIADEASK